MKRNCLILAVLVIGCVLLLQVQVTATVETKPELTSPEPAIGPAKAETASEANEPSPKITFEEVTRDLGEIGPGTKHLCEFKFTNTGTGLLKVGKVRATCGCTVPKLQKKEYAPGESGTLKVKYHSGKRPGRVTRRLFVPTNDESNPKVALSIKAKITIKIDYEPKKLKLLLKKENAGCPEITLTSLDNRPFAVRRFKSTFDCITADYDPSVKATRFVLEPKVNVEELQKGLNGHIHISLTHPECDTVAIPFNTLPKFTAEPPAIIAFDAKPQKPTTKEVWILNNYNEDFEVESTSSEKDIVKILSQEKIGNRYKFELEIVPPTAKGKQKIFTDTFFVNIKGGEQMKIICRGFYSKK